MTRRAVVTLAAVALGAGVFVPSVARAQNVCTKKTCAEEIDAGCAGLLGMELSACSKAVIARLQDHATDLLLYGPDAPYVHPDHDPAVYVPFDVG
jgi:hypothetical protein